MYYIRRGNIKIDKNLFILNKEYVDYVCQNKKEYECFLTNGAMFRGDDENRYIIIDVDKTYNIDSDFEYYQQKIIPILTKEIRKRKFKNII